MRRSLAHRLVLAVPAALAALALAAGPAAAGWVGGQRVDGPDPGIDVESVRVALASDGTGLLAYLKQEGGVAHVFAARLAGGAWGQPERVDAGTADPALGQAEQVSAAAAPGGRGVLAFTQTGPAGSRVYARRLGASGYGPPVRISEDQEAGFPALAMAPGGMTVAAFQQSDGASRRLRAARLAGGFWSLLPAPLDVNSFDDAGGSGRGPAVAVDEAGNATVVWAQRRPTTLTDRIWARQLRGAGVAGSAQVASPEDFEGFALDATASEPAVALAGDGGSGLVAFRQAPGGLAALGRVRVFANRFTVSPSGNQVFTGPELADDAANGPAEGDQQQPRVAASADGDGMLTFFHRRAGALATKTYARPLREGSFEDAQLVAASSAVSEAVPAIARDGTGAVAFVATEGGRRRLLGRRFAPREGAPGLRFGVPGRLSVDGSGDPGPPAAAAASLGDVVVAFGQAQGADGRVYAGAFDSPPTVPRPLRPRQRRGSRRVSLRWLGGRDVLGGATFTVRVDGRRRARGLVEKRFLTRRLRFGPHRYQVIARDRLGQVVKSRTRRFSVR